MTGMDIKADFPCDICGRMLHLDMADDLEGDETYVIPKMDGTGEERTICVQCWDKQKKK